MYTRIHTVPKTTDIYNKEELSEQLTRKTWQSITALRLANHVFSIILFSIIRNLCNLYRIIYGRLPQWIPILSYLFIIYLLFIYFYSFIHLFYLIYLFLGVGRGWGWGWGVSHVVVTVVSAYGADQKESTFHAEVYIRVNLLSPWNPRGS